MTPSRCQWPTTTEGRTLFCDAPVERGSYCGLCAQRAYAPAPRNMTDGSFERFVRYLERRGGV